MSEGEFLQLVKEAKARTTIFKFGDQDWRVTPFHCVVGPIKSTHFREIAMRWVAPLRADLSTCISGLAFVNYKNTCARLIHRDIYDYVYNWARDEIRHLREFYADTKLLFYTQDPLVVNEMQLGEVSLAVVENGEIILTNFVDLPNIVDALKAYQLGEYWLSYAEGGTEQTLRFGGPRK